MDIQNNLRLSEALKTLAEDTAAWWCDEEYTRLSFQNQEMRDHAYDVATHLGRLAPRKIHARLDRNYVLFSCEGGNHQLPEYLWFCATGFKYAELAGRIRIASKCRTIKLQNGHFVIPFDGPVFPEMWPTILHKVLVREGLLFPNSSLHYYKELHYYPTLGQAYPKDLAPSGTQQRETLIPSKFKAFMVIPHAVTESDEADNPFPPSKC